NLPASWCHTLRDPTYAVRDTYSAIPTKNWVKRAERGNRLLTAILMPPSSCYLSLSLASAPMRDMVGSSSYWRSPKPLARLRQVGRCSRLACAGRERRRIVPSVSSIFHFSHEAATHTDLPLSPFFAIREDGAKPPVPLHVSNFAARC